MAIKHIKALDGVRGIAILLVILFHYGYLGCGWVGVQLFFVLSGYLITSILVKDRQQSLGAYLKRFYWRRSLRIFPLYYLYLLGILVLFLLWGVPPAFRDQWPYLFTYTSRSLSSLLLFVPYLAITLLISYLSFQFFESKFLMLKDRRISSVTDLIMKRTRQT